MIHTVIVVHLARPWAIFHRRHMLVALAESLPPGVVLLCVDRPITLDVTWWRNPQRFLKGGWSRAARLLSPNLYLCDVRTILHDMVLARVSWVSRLNAAVMGMQLRKTIHGLANGNSRVIQWIYRPEQSWVRHCIPEARLIYECYDEYTSKPDGTPLPKVRKMEEELLAIADLTILTTATLLETRRHLARATSLLPNGIPDFFLESPSMTDDAVERIPRPRIGYVGVVRKPMNMDLLRDVFRQHPDWHLVVVGPVQHDSEVETIGGLANVHILGPRVFESIPAVLSQLDVGLIPHRVNAFSGVMRPLKLCEYLSAGLPVVSTALPELQNLPDFVHLTEESPVAFAGAIERALSESEPLRTSRAREWAREYTWKRIVERDLLPILKSAFEI